MSSPKIRTTIALDSELLQTAQTYTGVKEKSALIHEALTARAICATDEETMRLVERFHLYGTGIGYVVSPRPEYLLPLRCGRSTVVCMPWRIALDWRSNPEPR